MTPEQFLEFGDTHTLSEDTQSSESISSGRAITANASKNDQSEKVEKAVKEAFSQYKVFADTSNNTVYIAHKTTKQAEITDLSLQATIAKVGTFGQTESSKGTQTPLEQKKMPKMSKDELVQLGQKFDNITRHFTVNDKGRLTTTYVENGQQKTYDTGITPNRLRVMLAVSMKSQTTADSIIHLIGKRNDSGKSDTATVYSLGKSGAAAEFLHVGKQLAKGGEGTVSIAMSMSEKTAQVAILKMANVSEHTSASESITEAPKFTEAATLRHVNGDHKNTGIQENFNGAIDLGNAGVGLFGPKYDFDMTKVLDGTHSFSTKQILDVTGQLAVALDTMDKKEVVHPDIKAANVFFSVRDSEKKEGEKTTTAALGDWGGAAVLNSAYFDSPEFSTKPVHTLGSADSISTNNVTWLYKIEGALNEKKELLTEKENLLAAEGPTMDKKAKNALEAEIATLKKEISKLKNDYTQIMKGTQIWAVGHLLLQMLGGDSKHNIGTSDPKKLQYTSDDYKKIVDLIQKDGSLSAPEKAARLSLAAFMHMAMKDIGAPPKPYKADAQVPKLGVSLDQLQNLIHETMITYLKSEKKT